MGKQVCEFQNATFAYESQSKAIFENLSLQFSSGWTGVVGANGVGKTTLLSLAAGRLKPSTGQVRLPAHALYCQQRTDLVPDRFEDFLADYSHDAFVLKGRLKIEDDWSQRWESLSHGERKRSQIGTALWLEPELLAIDEPTNHLDADARCILVLALQAYSGIGLIVSHDRSLLDTLCRSCLFIDPPDCKIFPGGFSEGWSQLKRESKTLEKQELLARKELKKLDQEVARRRVDAGKADQKRSKRRIDRKDHDAKAKIDLARITGKDAVAGKLMNQLSGRREQAQKNLNSLLVKKTYETGIWQQGERSHRDLLFSLESGELRLGREKTLIHPRLEMKPEDRIALMGPNGSGKSTLLRAIIDALPVARDRVTYLPQEVDRKQSSLVLEEVKRLPAETLGYVMTFVNRLGTRPPSLLESTEPSPGEIRKVLLALGASRVPHLILMDEPTNHLDLVSIECLKESLSDFPAGLLLVSHDADFLEALTTIRWQIRSEPSHQEICRLEVL